ncbi:MAG: ATP-binding cassette domain-containing protein [Pseudomonadota bacterium]
MRPLLELDGVFKRYGDVTAVAPLSLAVRAGEVLALVGENGAGKSTVVNMVGGMTQPTGGSMRLDGRPLELGSPREAHAEGIGVVQQHYALVPSFTVAEMLALGDSGLTGLDRRAIRARVEELSSELGMMVDPDAQIGSLDVAGQQRVEILRALSRDIRLLVLDEPSAVLNPEDTDRLFQTIARLRERGIGIILVTHKLGDVFRACDRAAVLHSGNLVADRPVAELDEERLVSLIIAGQDDAEDATKVARAVSADFGDRRVEPAPRSSDTNREPLVSVRDLALNRPNGSTAVEGVSFNLNAGEIFAIAGVDGNGQSELVACLAGLALPASGHITVSAGDARSTLDSRNHAHWTPGALRMAGVVHIPDDRGRQGIAAALSLVQNLMISRRPDERFGRGPILNRARARAQTQTAIVDYAIRTEGPDQPIGRLSGGNQQKLVLARELSGAPRIVLAAHPSRGLDVRTIAAVQGHLLAARDRGAAVLLVSADLGETLRLADRIMVFAAGTARGPIAAAEADEARLGGWLTGRAA